ncbi:glycosyl hydrolase family 18 protein [Halobacillus amylolyticus]|uniref:Glycosyl hydrolase family 18 protein n=1 Tax=Halobacillus amylolyticus TaxID=2932259 RepID=A0ABY4HB52_9BACI|nr:glycosyl hydrolase family 18 protein [Halobacillus amylolyticus]UOR12081.1 glycosyl hydrolase family 18 protein [Halobacillus amylolyticus]
MLYKISICILSFIFVLNSANPVFASVIYVVKHGDTAKEIASKYNVGVDDITKTNGLRNINKLSPGQSLLIQGDTYIVEKGDSLWKIAQRHQLTVSQLIKRNSLKSNRIIPGQHLAIPGPSNRPNIMIGAFAYPSSILMNEDKSNIEQKLKFLSSIAAFEYHPDYNGQLSDLPHMETFKNRLWKRNITPYATVTNLSPSKGFDEQLAHHLLSNKQARHNLTENIYKVLNKYDLKGVVIDFEGLKQKDKSLFNQFIKELSNRLHPVGMEVALAVPPLSGPNTPSWNAAYDYQTLGQHADFLFLMTYDWHWLGGKPGPIAPISSIRKTLNYATSVISNEKIILGIPLYAYDWPLSDKNVEAEAYSQRYALEKAIEHGSVIHYDHRSGAPWFRYTDENGVRHEVWFEDARSLLAKYRLAKKYNLHGVGGWQIEFNFPQGEQILKEEFTISKTVE